MPSTKTVTQDEETSNGAVVVHVHRVEPRPLAVSDEETARRVLGFEHKRNTYRALGVPIAELPGARFAVLVADVEAALRARTASSRAPRDTSPQASDDDLDVDRGAVLWVGDEAETSDVVLDDPDAVGRDSFESAKLTTGEFNEP